ncbi:MAG: NAD(P)H-binding protein [Microbacterium sp.]
MTETILVTGGTGDIGRRVVPLLQAAGCHVRVLTRRGGVDSPGVHHVVGDTRRGRGIDAAMEGVSVVLHLAGGAKGDDAAAGHVVSAAASAGVRHVVLISVIGAGSVPVGYLRMKAAAERTVAEAGIPYTILRVAQLHSLLLPIVEKMCRMPLVVAPRGVRLEPVDGDVVAARLAELALAAPRGRVPDLAGPEVLGFDELVREVLDVAGRRRRIVSLPLPGAVGRAYRAGANLATADFERRGSTWRAAALASVLDAPVRDPR